MTTTAPSRGRRHVWPTESETTTKSPDPEREVLLTAKEVAEMFKTSEARLSNLRLYGGGPPFIRMGRAIRYRYSAIIAYLDDASVNS